LKLTQAPDLVRQPFLRFLKNYLTSRLFGYDGSSPAFPITDVENLSTVSSPQLNLSSRDRALYLCHVARALGIEKDAARFLLTLVNRLPPARGSSEEQPKTFTIKLLEELSGQKMGEDWARWKSWAQESS
jgi:hypothetical protein